MLVCRYCDRPLGWATEYCPFCGKAQPIAAAKEPAPITAPEVPLIPAEPAPVAVIEPRLEEEPPSPIDPPDLPPSAGPQFAPPADLDPHAEREEPGGRGFSRSTARPRAPGPAKASTSSPQRNQARGGRRRWWPAVPIGLTVLGLAVWFSYHYMPVPDSAKPPLTPTMVPIPAGRFSMGCQKGEQGCDADEKPAHSVQVPAFELGKYEVTFDEWDACVADGGCARKPSDNGWGRGKRPVINVSWDDAQQYVSWRSRETGKTYRLPTEAEWEYAARAGTTTAFSTGDCITTDQANYAGTIDYAGCGAQTGGYLRETQPVASYPANRWGLHDMHGNVFEWVQDCWHDGYTGAPADGSEWRNSCVASGRRVLRGGSWFSYPGDLRSANRYRFVVTGYRDNNLGFRVASTRETRAEPLTPAMVPIPAGRFSMGCQKGKQGCDADEKPAHSVQIPAFELGKYEVTFDEWDACVADGGCTQKPGDQGWGRGRQPVINVSWNDAQQYVTWLSRKTAKPYRLPSEAEWEYAARAGTQTRWSFGDDQMSMGDYAWFGGNAGAKTHPVGEKRPNPWGLYDMHGSVWEWVQDNWHNGYQGAPMDGRPWVDAPGGGRVLRGGGWLGEAQGLRSASRSRGDPGARLLNGGFRLALGPQPGREKASR